MAIVIVPNTDTFEEWRVKTNTIGSGVGDLTTLNNDSVLAYTGLNGENEDDFTGTPATFTITDNQGTYEVEITNGGSGYAPGDEVVVRGNELGGVYGVNDATITITSVGVGNDADAATVAGTTTPNLVAQVNTLREDVGDTNTALATNAEQVRDAINEFESVLRGDGDGQYSLDTDAQNIVAAVNELEAFARGQTPDYSLDTTATDVVNAINEHESDIGTIENLSATGTSANADPTHDITYVNLGSDLVTAVNSLKTKSDYFSEQIGGDMGSDYDGPDDNIIDALDSLYNRSDLGTLDNTYLRRSGTLEMQGILQLHSDGITSNANNLLLKTGAADNTAVTISATNQNVGIGGSVGTQKLKVTGGVNATTGFYYNGDDTDTRYIRADVGSAQTLSIDTTVTSTINLNPTTNESVIIAGSTVATDTLTYLEWFQDTTGAMFTGNDEQRGITATYNDTTGKIDLQITNNSHTHDHTTITDWDEAVQDTAAGMITSATHSGLTTTYDDGTGRLAFNVNDPVITISGEASGSATMTNLGNTNISVTLQHEAIQDAVGEMLSGNTETGIQVDYDDANNQIDFQLTADPTISLAGDLSGSVTLTNLATQTFTLTATVLDDSHNHVVGNIDNFTEEVQDIVGGMVNPTNVESGIVVTYDDNNGKLNFDVNDPTITLSGDVVGSATMSNLGSINISCSVNNDSHNHDGRYYTESEMGATGGAALVGTLDEFANSNSSNVQDVLDDLDAAISTKLASASYTAADVLAKIKTVDGAGSGLDADTLDGVTSGSFLRSDANDTATGNLTMSHVYARSNNAYDIGASGTRFRTMYATTFNGTSTAAQYADLAENYLADQDYPVGTVIAVGGVYEVTAANDATGHSVIGVVSENPAYLMNKDLEGGTAIALKGRVQVRAEGIVRKGDRLAAGSIPGVAVANNVQGNWQFAVALQDKTEDNDTVEAVIL